MADVPSAGGPGEPRGRRVPRLGGDARQLAILETAERLLDGRDLDRISIDDLARGAGISRPTFYFYFASKEAVLLALLDGVVAEADAAAADLLERLADDPAARWRAAIGAFFETFRRHRPVTLAAAAVRSTDSEVRRLWAGVLEQWTRRTAAAIEAERARGAAPAGVPARDLAIALNSMNERVLSATFAGDGPTVAEDDVVEVLLDIWLAAIYRAPPGPDIPA